MRNYFEDEPMKYFAPPASMNQEVRRMKLEQMIKSGEYLFSTKIDGNWSRAIITNERNALQTRGISKKTGTYGEIQDKVFFWDNVTKAFQNGTTVLLGEVFMEGCIDRQIGSILRCLTPKALERQKDKKLRWYIFDVLCYDGIDLMNTSIEERIKYIPKVVERINSPLVEGAIYYEMNNSFFDIMNEVFASGGEGCVCYKKNAKYIPGKRGPHAWESVKVKQEINNDVDVLITGLIPCERAYQGGDLPHWELWRNTRTNELVYGLYYTDYQLGEPYEPVSKNYFNNWCGAIEVSVYDNQGNLIPICNVAGLTEDLKTQLRDNFKEWYLCPVTIGGMMISEAGKNGIPSIRHPYLKSIRKNDIDPKDCTLEKILS